MKQDDDSKPEADSNTHEVPGGPAAMPNAPEGREAAEDQGEEA
jgi:hypothetical protein